jgi:hypothetical protein
MSGWCEADRQHLRRLVCHEPAKLTTIHAAFLVARLRMCVRSSIASVRRSQQSGNAVVGVLSRALLLSGGFSSGGAWRFWCRAVAERHGEGKMANPLDDSPRNRTPIVDEIGDAEIHRAYLDAYPSLGPARHRQWRDATCRAPDGIAITPATAGPAGKFRLRTLSHVPAG